MDVRMALVSRWVWAVVGLLMLTFAPWVRAAELWESVDRQILEGDAQAPVPILEVHFAYDAQADPDLKLSGMELKRGHAPQHDALAAGHQLELLSVRGDILTSLVFQIPNVVYNPPPEGMEQGDGEPVPLAAVDFALTLTMPEAAVSLRVLDPQGQVLLTESLRALRMQYEEPDYDSLKPRASAAPDGWLARIAAAVDAVLMPAAEAAVNSAAALDVAIVGDNYTAGDMALFHNDVNRIVSHMLTYEPYKSRASQILFHRVENSAVDLQCKYSTTTARLLTCNGSAVTNVVNNAGAPYDKIIVLVKSSTYGGSGGSISVSYNGSSAPQVVVHEFGHSLANLLDEYNLYSTNGSVTNTVYANCYAGTPPSSLWNLLTGVTYTKGCKYPNWYRSSPCSIMQSLSCKYFNEVSKKAINDKLNFYAGTAAAPQPDPLPVLTLAAAPPLVTLNGSTALTWSAADATSCAASGAWSGTKAVNGSEAITPAASGTFSMTCTGPGGSDTKSVAVTVDAQSPNVALTSPANGAVVEGAVTLAASATDNLSVQRVDFYTDGSLAASDNTSPYTLTTSLTEEGQHTLLAQAVDTAGNLAASTPVTVVVEEEVVPAEEPVSSQDNISPVANIPSRLSGISVSGKLYLSGSATDNVAVTRIELYVDRVLKYAKTGVTSIGWWWDTSKYAVGPHEIMLKAYDAAGNSGVRIITINKQ